jgi:hypothetical protein
MNTRDAVVKGVCAWERFSNAAAAVLNPVSGGGESLIPDAPGAAASKQVRDQAVTEGQQRLHARMVRLRGRRRTEAGLLEIDVDI